MDRTKKQRLKGMSGGTIDRKKAVGYCRDHRVALTTRTLKNHKCLSKQCDALKRYEDHPFWIEREQKKKAKKARKQALSGNRPNEEGDLKMKQGKVLLFPMFITAGVCLIALIVGLVCMHISSEDTEKAVTVFGLSSETDVRKLGHQKSVSGDYEFTADIFGYEGKTVVKVADEKVTSIFFTASEEDADELTGEEAKAYADAFVKAYSKELGFPIIEEPKLIQFADDNSYKDCPEDKYEALSKGYVLFEYSYRDDDGVLWIIQIYSPSPEVMEAVINKYPDDSGYAGFEPQINLQKDVKK